RHGLQAAQEEQALEALVDHLVELPARLDLLRELLLADSDLNQVTSLAKFLARLGIGDPPYRLIPEESGELALLGTNCQNSLLGKLRDPQNIKAVSAPHKARHVGHDVILERAFGRELRDEALMQAVEGDLVLAREQRGDGVRSVLERGRQVGSGSGHST